MSSREFPEIEPFGEAPRSNDCGNSSEMLRYGYRVVGTDTVLAAIDVPLSVVQQSVPRVLSARLSPNGIVTTSLDFNELGRKSDVNEISLVALVEGLLDPHRLFMEEIKAADLSHLLRNLEASLLLVEAATAALTVRAGPPAA